MALEGEAVLDKLATLAVSTWRYESEPEGTVHVGPMAQDFAAMFGLGADDTKIAGVDAIGVLLVAVQALYHRVVELERRIAE